jgi:aromatic ring hydroxylase
LHKVADTEHGIVVRGARVLATLAPFADELAVYPAAPLPEGADAYALSFCVPMGAPGLKFMCRDSVSAPANRFDHPLSSRFDEQDAFVIFDDVEVPRDRVFIDCNRAAYNKVPTTSWSPNIQQQTMIRASTKLDFAWGLALRMAAAINAADPETMRMIGEIWAYAEFTRSAVATAEAEAREWPSGLWTSASAPLHALRAMLPLWFPRVNEILRLIGSHNVFATPTAAQMADKDLRPLIDRYLPGAKGMAAEERIRIFRLVWDFAGSALASRNEQYERFYLASSPRNLARHLAFTDRSRADRLVDRFLKEPY